MGEDNNSSHDIPLVKLDLHNVTYRPKTKTYGKANSNKAYSFKKSDGPSNDDTSTSKPVLRKTILNNVTPPSIEPYKLQAWMGPSGSGKTTLLSIAAGMTAYDSDSFSDESRITINNDKENMFTKKGGFPKGLVGIVWQDDLLLSYLTVRETIEFAAKMKTPESEVHRVPQMVDEVLDDLGLTGVQHSLIGQSHGGPGRGISGGERKRVSVAVELVSKPSIIFLDEPTSGLDSTSAFELMLTLKKLARKGGHAIVAVIHQPRTTIFDLFDGLLLLSKGEEVYSGPANGARAVLESCPIIGSPLPEQTNVADWIMDMIMKDENRAKLNDADEESSNGRVLARHWANIKSNVENEDEASSQIEDIEGKNKYQRLVSLAEIKNSVPRYTSSFATQLRMLTRRAIKQTRGEKISNAAIITTLAYIFFESLFWFRLKDDTNSIYERNSLVFFMIIAQGNGVVISSIPTFKRDRNLLTRERQKKMYQVLPYFIAKTLAGESMIIIGEYASTSLSLLRSNLISFALPAIMNRYDYDDHVACSSGGHCLLDS